MNSHKPNNQVVNVLSIDVEEWYQGALMSKSCVPHENRVRANTEKILDVLAEFGAKGTFFFVGSIGEQHPELVRRVQSEGCPQT